MKNFLYAWRVWLKNPAFAGIAVATIALGIGASTAVFSVARAVLLRPLPYKSPATLVLACVDMSRRGVKDLPISNADFVDLRNGTHSVFEDIAAVQTNKRISLKDDGASEQVRVASVTTNFFPLIGATVVRGHDFAEGDGDRDVAILSYEYWQRRYGSDAAIVGRSLSHDLQNGAQIVGVLAPGVELLFPPDMNVERAPDVWIAARIPYDVAARKTFAQRVVARLKPGVTVGQAQSQAEQVASALRDKLPIWQSSGYHIRVESMQQYLTAKAQPAIVALLGAAIVLLLIACSNVANLLLVRVSSREQELALRAALGGTRWQIIRQMLAESFLLAGAGTLLGLGVAWLGMHELLAIAPPSLPRMETIGFDPVVFAFAALMGLFSTSLFGLVPALRASRPNVMQVLKSTGRTSGLSASGALRNVVVVSEVALSFVLLVGMGLMLRSFLALQGVHPGYDAHRVLSFQILAPPTPSPAARAALVRNIHDTLQRAPGIESVTAASPFPLADSFFPIRWGTADALADPGKFQAVDYQIVLPGYFQTLRTPLLGGRTFADAENIPERNVAVIDQLLAAKAFPHQSAVGKRILIRLRTPEPEWVEVIGVVAHQRAESLTEAGREQIYFTDGFANHGAATRWAVRTIGDPASYAGTVRAQIAAMGDHLLITEMQPMEALVDRANAATRFWFVLIGVFAGISLLLAGIGLYGVLSSVVRQRTSEIGIRLAVGATPVSIFTLVVGQGLRLSAAGAVVGALLALGATRAMRSMLVGVTATDPLTFAMMALLFLCVAGVASWLPARRASALDPTAALRDE